MSEEDIRAIKSFVPGIWDATDVHNRLLGLEKRTGSVSHVGCLWSLTAKGKRLRAEWSTAA